jgi:hypothetical protein
LQMGELAPCPRSPGRKGRAAGCGGEVERSARPVREPAHT